MKNYSKDLTELEWLTTFSGHSDRAIAEYFESGAGKIVEWYTENKFAPLHEGLFLPIAYLYRHSIELYLKELIRIAVKYELLSPSSDKWKGCHDLYQLWRIVYPPLEKDWTSDRKILNRMKETIKKLHQIDPNGQHLKYTEDSKSNPTNKTYPKDFLMSQFSEECKFLATMLRSSYDYWEVNNEPQE